MKAKREKASSRRSEAIKVALERREEERRGSSLQQTQQQLQQEQQDIEAQPRREEWTRIVEEGGYVYFYNPRTEERLGFDPKTKWVPSADANGNEYFYHQDTLCLVFS